MYLHTSWIVAEHLLELQREADEARLAAAARRAGTTPPTGLARRLVARVALAVSATAAAVAAWSDPTIDRRPGRSATVEA